MTESDPVLIYDIGAHAGDDTSVYLQLGYKVISVEANPHLVEKMYQRFEYEIKSGKLVLLNIALSSTEDEVVFYINDDDTKSSLFHKAEKSITLHSKPLHLLFEEFGVPFYCKIDIEGSDLMALQSLAQFRPKYISVEISGKSLKELKNDRNNLFLSLEKLYELGYSKFKLVDQERLNVLSEKSFYRSNLSWARRLQHKLRMFLSATHRQDFLNRFHLGRKAEVSGYPSPLLEGDWYSYQDMKAIILFHFEEYISVVRSFNIIFWVDLHATE